MWILAVDTATSSQGVAILQDNRVVAHSQTLSQAIPPSRNLLPTIHEMLGANSLTIVQIEGFAVSIGPGSFTGLRVGLATLLGLRMKLGIPVIGVPTLEAMAHHYHDSTYRVCPILKAGKGEVYWAQFHCPNGEMVRLSEDRVGSVVECMESIGEPTVMFGEGWFAHKKQFELTLGTLCLQETSGEIFTLAVNVGILAMRQYQVNPKPPHRIVPRYIHPSYAQQRKENSHTIEDVQHVYQKY